VTKHAAMVVGVAVLGWLGAYLLPSGQEARWLAFLGVAAAAFSGAAALTLKRWALSKSLQAAFAVMGLVFGMRLILAVAGLAYAKGKNVSPMPFVTGFFATYFVVQWVEISYVLAESKRRGPGGL